MSMRIAKLGRGVVALALVAAAACGAEEEDTRPAELSFIVKAILRPSCATAPCHSEHVAPNGVALHDAEAAYRTLVDQAFIDPQAPDTSTLPKILRGEGRERMPPDQPLAEVDIQLIETWILAGAKQD
jgi:hypothetical protein